MTNKGTRIRELRLLLGMTQREFAEYLSAPQPQVSAIERGLKPADTLAQRAVFTFGVSTSFFDQPANNYPSGSLNFRTKKIPAKVMDAANNTFGELERAARHLLRGLPRIDLTADGLQDRSDALPIDQINTIAAETRRLLHVERSGPVLNVTRAIERAGVPVVRLHNPFIDFGAIEGISSPSIHNDRGVVSVTDQVDGARARFTRAHELGHLVLHTGIRPGIEKVRELEAHQFAGAFLMPATDAYRKISPNLTLEGFARVKAEYAISIAALIRRAKELRIITPERYRSLNIQLSSRGWSKTEPVAVPLEVPKLIERLDMTGTCIRIPPKPVAVNDHPAGGDVIDLFQTHREPQDPT